MEELMDDEQELIDYMGSNIEELTRSLVFAVGERIKVNWENLEARVILSPSIGKEAYMYIEPIHSDIKTITAVVHKPTNTQLAIKGFITRLVMKKPVRIERIDDYSFHIKGLNRKD